MLVHIKFGSSMKIHVFVCLFRGSKVEKAELERSNREKNHMIDYERGTYKKSEPMDIQELFLFLISDTQFFSHP